MKKVPFVTGWTCRHLEDDGCGVPVSIPHDAARYEKRTAVASGGVNTGWMEAYDYLYENRFSLQPEWDGKQLLLEFEGVYRNAEVWLNGQQLAFRPYGYTNFYVDLTGKLKEDNTLQVIARNADQPNSRWYSGAGIYRPVTLWVGEKQYIPPNGLKIRTISLNPPVASVTVITQGTGHVDVTLFDGETVIGQAGGESGGHIQFEIPISSGKPWHPDLPKIYTCIAGFSGDVAVSDFGLRTIAWGRDGFRINGERFLLQGACIHHDNGLLGAICDPDAVSRKVRLLKENGYNAIRSAHNPCSKALLQECDRQGMLVLDEYADQWYIHKTMYDYAEYCGEWWRQDLTDMVEKDYNHPCVVMYSIGNEVSETAEFTGVALTREMTQFLHSLDDTRPVTCGINLFFNFLSAMGLGQYSDEKARREAEKALKRRQQGKKVKEKTVGSSFFNKMAGLLGDEFMKWGATLPPCDWKTREAFHGLDITGYNYGIYRYAHDLKKYPDRLILGTETFCGDGYRFRELAEKEPRLIGDFVWTGMDYLGETMLGAWEYGAYAHRFDGGLGWISAGAGRLDLTGKPLGEALYTRVALAGERGPYLAVRPVCFSGQKHSPSAWKMTDTIASWSWEGCEGKIAQVEVYARAHRVLLLLNGRCVGEKKAGKDCRFCFSVPYENGELKAIALDHSGKEVGTCRLCTAGKETQLRAEPESAAAAPGRLCYVRLRYTDAQGITKPMLRGTLKVQVEGAELLALGNACPFNERGFLTDETETYYGEAMAILRMENADAIHFSVSDGMYSASIDICKQ